MAKSKIIDKTIKEKYKFGFVTNIDQETIPPGLMKRSYILSLLKRMNLNGCLSGD